MQGDNGSFISPSMVAPQGWVQQEQPVSPPKEEKDRKDVWWLLGGVILAAVIIILIVVFAVILPNLRGEKPEAGEIDRGIFSIENVEEYCVNNELDVIEIISEMDDSTNQIECMESHPGSLTEEELLEVKTVRLVELGKPISETVYQDNVSLLEDNAILMKGAGDRKEFYAKITDRVYVYYIVDKYYMMTFSSIDAEWLAKALKDFTEIDITKYSEAVEEKRVDYEDMKKSEAELAIIRQKDMDSFAEAVLKYQASNRDSLPVGPSFWEGEEEINCDSVNISCKFVKEHLNGGKTKNGFTDPDGMPYSVYITENLAESGNVALYLMSEENKLVETTEGYKIGGTAPYKKHIMYMVPGGRCSSGDEVGVIKGSKEQFAIIYQVTSRASYCLDSQSMKGLLAE